MTKIAMLKRDILRLQGEQADLISEFGHIESGGRYEYQLLTRKIAYLKGRIELAEWVVSDE